VPEWTNGAVSKTVDVARRPWVRIPSLPPTTVGATMPSDDLAPVRGPAAPSDGQQADQARRPQGAPHPPPWSRYPIEQPVRIAWREGTLTRAEELESLHAWVAADPESKQSEVLAEAIRLHLAAARTRRGTSAPVPDLRQRGADRARDEQPGRRGGDLLNIAPPNYVLGQLPSLLNHVQRHLLVRDPRRQEFEDISR
jgi:hypothetical protein